MPQIFIISSIILVKYKNILTLQKVIMAYNLKQTNRPQSFSGDESNHPEKNLPGMLCIFNSSFSSRVELSCGTIYSKKFSFLSPTYALARSVDICFTVYIYNCLIFMHRIVIGGRFFELYKIRLFSSDKRVDS